jgi:hypothetical protein
MGAFFGVLVYLVSAMTTVVPCCHSILQWFAEIRASVVYMNETMNRMMKAEEERKQERTNTERGRKWSARAHLSSVLYNRVFDRW